MSTRSCSASPAAGTGGGGLDQAELGRVVDAAFAQRRKTLRNALRGLGLDPADVEALGRAESTSASARSGSASRSSPP